MKKYFLLSVLCFCAISLFAQTSQTAKVDTAAPAQSTAPEEVSNEKVLYSLGYILGNNLKTQLILDTEDDYKALSQGMRDSLLERKSQTNLEAYRSLIEQKYRADGAIISAKRKTAQNEYLAKVKRDKKSKTLSNGAVIQITKKGSGKAPKSTDTVKVHYTGRFLDGTVFDSSVTRGTPSEFVLNGVISCWTVGLQEMKPGSKALLYCPPETAYGSMRAGPIEPDSLLLFDVELLEVK